MTAERFLDTNILVYAYDLDAGTKHDIALALVEEAWEAPARFAISVQVLQEFHVNIVRLGRPIADATALVQDLSHWQVVENTVGLLHEACALQDRWQLSLWDAMILAAAHDAGARELLTEDLNHGQDYGGVVVVNPFRK